MQLRFRALGNYSPGVAGILAGWDMEMKRHLWSRAEWISFLIILLLRWLVAVRIRLRLLLLAFSLLGGSTGNAYVNGD
jgi:hypothetical protein